MKSNYYSNKILSIGIILIVIINAFYFNFNNKYLTNITTIFIIFFLFKLIKKKCSEGYLR